MHTFQLRVTDVFGFILLINLPRAVQPSIPLVSLLLETQRVWWM